jgi:hypothetical protein
VSGRRRVQRLSSLARKAVAVGEHTRVQAEGPEAVMAFCRKPTMPKAKLMSTVEITRSLTVSSPTRFTPAGGQATCRCRIGARHRQLSRTRRLGARSDISRHSAACSLHSTTEIICPYPRTFAPGQCCHGQQDVVSIVSRLFFTSAPIVTFAPHAGRPAIAPACHGPSMIFPNARSLPHGLAAPHELGRSAVAASRA